MKKALVIGVLVLGIGAGSLVWRNAVRAPQTTRAEIVTYADDGFSPPTITVKAGTAVTFKNEGASAFWPATALHPTHRVYPGSDIAKCGTPEESAIFDACRGIAPGGEYSFTFTEVGTWKYHNHLDVRHTGTIVVTE